MRDPGGSVLRAVRAAVLALCCVLLPVGGHVLAGGPGPSPALLISLTAGSWAVLFGCSRRPWRVRDLGLAVCSGQLLLHPAFLFGAAPHHTGALHDMAPSLSGRMLLAHLLAAALTVARAGPR